MNVWTFCVWWTFYCTKSIQTLVTKFAQSKDWDGPQREVIMSSGCLLMTHSDSIHSAMFDWQSGSSSVPTVLPEVLFALCCVSRIEGILGHMTEPNLLLKTVAQRLEVTLLLQDSTLQIYFNDAGFSGTVSHYLGTMCGLVNHQGNLRFESRAHHKWKQ